MEPVGQSGKEVTKTGEAVNEASVTEVRQRLLGTKGLVVFLALLSAFVPLSTDLYLPALPTMTRYFSAPEYQTNLTLILFFVFYSVSILIWGPLSDRYGRRPILLMGLALYTVAGVLCAISFNVFQLMLFRVVQSIGTGSASAVATAIVKDVYADRRREKVLALVQTMAVISPAVAPMVGALILNVMSWRGTFVAQAVLGLAVLGMSVAFRETLTVKSTGSALGSLRRLGVVLQSRTFTALLVLFAPVSIAGLAFVSSSSYIFQETFGVSSEGYSVFFAIFALGLAVGPQLYLVLSRGLARTAIITGCFALTAISGVLVILFGHLGPGVFILALWPTSIALSCMRPPFTHIMLDQHEGDGGSASALMTSSHMIMGCIGMLLTSIHLADRVLLIGLLNAVVGVLCVVAWLALVRPLVRVRPRPAARDSLRS